LLNYAEIFSVTAPYLGVAASGFLLKRFRIVKGRPEQFLLKLFMNLFFPALIFNFIYGNRHLQHFGDFLMLPVSGFLSVGAGFAAAYMAAPLLGLSDSGERRAFTFSIGVYNNGFLALPIITYAFGKSAAGGLLLFNFGNDLIYWTIGIMILTGSFRTGIKKLSASVPCISLAGFAAMNMLVKPVPLSGDVAAFFSFISFLTMPLGLFISGLALGEGMSGISMKNDARLICGSIFLRQFLLSLLFLLAAKYLVDDGVLKIILTVQSAMPAGMMNLAMVRFFMGESRVAAVVVFYTTISGIVTIPLWLHFAFRFAGL
jgi:predicted permease